ncbi:MAG: class I SAM-dependent methyltransferase [Candidatus Solibacter usitatus]|nr:class I SAM-dependent methyltransferase [Candidatus Solibacter usitatus]
MSLRTCWCGGAVLQPWGGSYQSCACGTLVSNAAPESVTLYGSDYWFGHQTGQLGHPDLRERARVDLPERCAYWLKTLLEYQLPPARVLEIGSGHGGFVSLLRMAGYDATGLEVDSEVAALSREMFGIPVLAGTLESQELPAGSLDAVVLMDVLEHLPRPAETLSHCMRLLRPDGLLLVQTPCFDPGRSHAELGQASDPFLRMLLPESHLYLFSRQSVQRLLNSLGMTESAFEQPLFPQHDMFVAASTVPLSKTEPSRRDASLLATCAGRHAAALLDAVELLAATERRLAECEADRAARLSLIQRQHSELQRLMRPLWRRITGG